MDENFRREMLQIGILSYREQETLWNIAQRCASTAGIPMGGAAAVMGASIGTVTVPGVGAIPGWAAGFLAGLVGGTFSCVMLNQTYRNELRKLANGQ